jgi:excisionase family DNA binding protein
MKSNEDTDRWLSVDEIADYLGVAKDTIYAWVTGKGMPGHKVGRFWKFKKDDVDIWVREGGAASGSDDFDEKGQRS